MRNCLYLVKKILLTFSIVFTAATLASCIINLALGQKTDTYLHIIDRAVLTLIGSTVLMILLSFNFQHFISRFFIPYLIFMPLAFLYVYISGFFSELHPNAYRDIFLNDTIAYIVVYFAVRAYERIRKHK